MALDRIHILIPIRVRRYNPTDSVGDNFHVQDIQPAEVSIDSTWEPRIVCGRLKPRTRILQLLLLLAHMHQLTSAIGCLANQDL